MLVGEIAVTGRVEAEMATKPRMLWCKADYAAINNYMVSVPWETLFDGLSADDCCTLLIRTYDEAVKLFIPTTTCKFVAKNELWLTPVVMDAVQAKRATYFKWLSASDDTRERQTPSIST